MTGPIAVGIDLGGTNLRVAAVDGQGQVLARLKTPTPTESPPASTIQRMTDLVSELMSMLSMTRADLIAVGIGAPGPLSPRDGRIVRSANLPTWQNVPLRDLLAEKLGTKVWLENDANAAAFGEYWVGAGRGGGDLVLFTLGTGVGSGIILNGRLLHGHFENAGELGHMILELDGLPCPCGQRGCLEQYASASGLARRTYEELNQGRPSSLSADVQAGRPLDAALIAEHAQRGDALSLRIWDSACAYLAIACVNVQHSFNPSKIVLGGGLAQAGAFLLDRVRAEFLRRTWKLHDDVPRVVGAELGDNAGVIGAAGLAMRCD